MSIIEQATTKTRNALAAKKILTDDDLVRWIPRKYYDYRTAKEIVYCSPDTHHAVLGVIKSVESKRGVRRYLSVKVAPTNDAVRMDGKRYFSVLFFSRTFLANRISELVGKKVVIFGKVCFDRLYGYTMPEPDNIIPAEQYQPHIATVYPKIGGVSDNMLRDLIRDAIADTHEPFEWELMNQTTCIDYKSALAKLHFPASAEDINTGNSRLLLNDLLYFAIGLKKAHGDASSETGIILSRHEKTDALIDSLPYELTPDQKTTLSEAFSKSACGMRLNMLLQGDVGSGKTIVAIMLMSLAAENGYQSVLMAPRAVLARQHFEELKAVTGREDIAFLHSGMKSSERKKILTGIKNGSISMVIGTHSCISKDVEYKQLGLVVTDEEHLFGVEQKEEILCKAQAGVHMVSMSATPIPRTLAGVIYGEDKEIVQIRTMPKGRIPIKSAIMQNREQVFPFMYQQILAGHQCYVVCPAIDNNEDTDIISIEEMEKAYHEYFDKLGVTIVTANGKMDREKADAAISAFESGKAQILLSTTVIEVGVNIPNATVIVIEQAERFGLASLHQLRGRVGRSTFQSYCILRSDDTENERLKIICSTTDGFEIAEADLKQRGTGNLLGVQQAGANKYIDLMLSYPDYYKQIQQLAAWCVENGFGKGLMELYFQKEVTV